MSDIVKQEIDIAAPIERVYRALTDHEEFGSWFGVKCTAPFECGKFAQGTVSFRGEEFPLSFRVIAMDSPDFFSFTWHPYAVDKSIDYSDEIPTLVEFRLKETGGGTHLTVTESGFDAIPPARRAEAFRMNNHGWEIQTHNIKEHIEGVESDPA